MSNNLCFRLGVLALAVGLGGWPLTSLATEWKPTKEIELVVHNRAGSGVDTLLRQLADIWTKHRLVSVNVRVSNRPGARGKKARRYVSETNSGNQHMLFGWVPSQLNGPLLMGLKDNHRKFTPIAIVTLAPQVLAVNAKSPHRTLEDLVTAARKNPGKITQGGGIFGAVASITGALFAKAHDLDITYTPFKGGVGAVLQLLGGHIDFVIENPSELNEHIRAGSLRVLATSRKVYPGVPTFEQAGYEFKNFQQYRGLVAPPNIPKSAQRYYIDLLKRTGQTPEWKQYLKRFALTGIFVAGGDLAKAMDDEAQRRIKVNKELGLVK